MKKILLIGNAPLPQENLQSRPAAGLRTYQFLKSVLDFKGYQIGVVTIAMSECYKEEVQKKIVSHPENYRQLLISKDDPSLIKEIQKFHDDFQTDVIIGVNTYPAYISSRIKSNAPFWADLNGWIMAEAQAQADKTGSNDYLSHYFGMEKAVLSRADKISTVSEAQKFATLGELAFLGRLSKETFNYQFCHHIPNGTEDFGEGANTGKDWDLPNNSFVALWVGGYNTWVDEKTLFEGLEKAMSECEKLIFVSTGGEIKGLDNKTFANFKNLIENSRYKGRFKFLGWIDTREIASLYKKASVGLNVDRLCTETLTGARNRINEMMKFGLPVITSLGSEISYEVEKSKSGIGFQSGNAEAFSKALASIYKEWNNGELSDKYKNYGINGSNYIKENCNYQRIMQPLIEWLKNPGMAPDRGGKVNLGTNLSLKALYRYLKENGFKKSFKKLLQKI